MKNIARLVMCLREWFICLSHGSVWSVMHFNLGPPPPTDVTAVKDGPTSIRVTWTPPAPLDGITGYRISFTGGSSGSETVSGGNTMSHSLTGLTNGETYTISIVASTNGLSSAPVQTTVGLGMFHLCVCRNISSICCQCYIYVQFSTIVCSLRFHIETLFHSSVSSSP